MQFKNLTNLKIEKFKVDKAIGRGGFGRVYVVEKNGKQFAMKEMYKARVMQKNSAESVCKELQYLKIIDKKYDNSQFIIGLQYAF